MASFALGHSFAWCIFFPRVFPGENRKKRKERREMAFNNRIESKTNGLCARRWWHGGENGVFHGALSQLTMMIISFGARMLVNVFGDVSGIKCQPRVTLVGSFALKKERRPRSRLWRRNGTGSDVTFLTRVPKSEAEHFFLCFLHLHLVSLGGFFPICHLFLKNRSAPS